MYLEGKTDLILGQWFVEASQCLRMQALELHCLGSNPTFGKLRDFSVALFPHL